VLLVVVSTLPLVLLTGVLLTRLVAEQLAADERRLLQLARAQALILDREFDASVRTLTALAQSDYLQDGDLEAFDRIARRIAPTQPSWHALFVQTPDGRRVIDTSQPPGVAPVGPVAEPASFENVLRTRQPVVGSLRRGDDMLAFPVRVPVLRGGEVEYVLTAVVLPHALSDAVTRELPPGEEWARTIVDAGGTVVARTRDAERFVGAPATQAADRQGWELPEVVTRDLAMDGTPVYLAYTRSRYGWTSAVSVPLAAFDGPIGRTVAALLAFGAFAIALAGAGAWWLAGRVARQLHETSAAAEMLARGEPPKASTSVVAEVTTLADAIERSGALLAERERERDAHLRAAQEARAAAESSQRAAEAAARSKDEFLAMLGHELRNPLSPIVTALHLLRLRGEGQDREHGIIARQVQHLTRLVDDLLDVSRIARGLISLSQEHLTVGDAIDQAIEMSGPLFEERQHRLDVSVADGCHVIGDRARLAQVFANVLVNAAKYTPPGGQVTLQAGLEGDTVVVTVRDTGEGIPPGLLPHVFELFTQGVQSTDRRLGGLGLGLTIVQQLVRLHGGTVAAESAGQGQGSTFTIRLPAAPMPAAAAPAPRAAQPLAALAARILVVDDNQDAAEMLTMLLRQQGHDARTAYDGPGAFAAAAEFRPRIVILDIGLPVLDGYEVAERLRAELQPDPPTFVAVTGYGQRHDRARSAEAGFAAHLVKPLDFAELTDLLAGLITGQESA
jgi:signal transduction histidine kinase/ActR/RegA family two-component response regulator